MTRRRHRCPWAVETVGAGEVAAGDRLVIDGYDYTVTQAVPAGLALDRDGWPLAVELALAHPTGRRGRPRGFAAPDPLEIDRLRPVQRVAGAADWRGF